MNQSRRKQIRTIIYQLEEQKAKIEEVLDGESEALENIPENLQGTEKYEAMETVIDKLSEILDEFDNLISNLTETIEE